jgi:hypothetical protein
LLEAARRGDEERFSTFNTEWERIDNDDDGNYHLRFPGIPRYHISQGFCYHCERIWVLEGIAFGDPMPGLATAMHMNIQCERAEECLCWSELSNDDPATIFPHPFCQACWNPEPHCECAEIVLGSCAAVERHERLYGIQEIDPDLGSNE